MIRTFVKNNAASLIFIAAGAVLAAAGILQGGFVEIMRKAANVCLECIGIG
ncbi:MAG: thioredoxin [Defluviitaleaceae bacterium]|nr:thioredoxin [Defluviitaleaceae bacterium]